MAEYVGATPVQTVATDQNVLLVDSIPCNKGYVLHRNGSGIVTLRGITNGCSRFARYKVSYGANIAIPEGGAAQAIALGLTLNGEPLADSRAIVTPAAAEQYFSVHREITIDVPSGCCYTLAIENVNAGVGEDIDQVVASVANPNLNVSRIA